MKSTENYKILNNGVCLFDGAEISCKVIYNNISGKNMYGELYYMYLHMLHKECGLESGTIALIDSKGEVIEKSIIRINN